MCTKKYSYCKSLVKNKKDNNNSSNHNVILIKNYTFKL